jgi:hypothetical protein
VKGKGPRARLARRTREEQSSLDLTALRICTTHHRLFSACSSSAPLELFAAPAPSRATTITSLAVPTAVWLSNLSGPPPEKIPIPSLVSSAPFN